MRMSVLMIAIPALFLGLPLLGAWIAGNPLAPYFQFFPPPQTIQHAPFSWTIFWLIAIGEVALIIGCLRACGSHFRPHGSRVLPFRPLPFWGWLALGTLLLSWIVAWTRIPFFTVIQSWSFIPLWVSYIFFINALTYRRTGSCLLLSQPRHFLILFPASSLLWWYFEYLNHFVQNWHYIGVESLSIPMAILHASLAFSTVLPAIVSTEEWIRSFPLWRTSLPIPRVLLQKPTVVAGTLGVVSAITFTGVGIWPNALFPIIWIAPLGLILSLLGLGKHSAYANCAPRSHHDRPRLSGIVFMFWAKILSTSGAVLLCGLLWEMWNDGSAAQWIYTIPYVQKFMLFKMPILGYAGYLPFGLFCMIVADIIAAYVSPSIHQTTPPTG